MCTAGKESVDASFAKKSSELFERRKALDGQDEGSDNVMLMLLILTGYCKY